MLSAKNDLGEWICLADVKEWNELAQLKTKSHYCPCCDGKLVLRLGTHRVPHFAHVKHSACSEEHDGESLYHLQGKLDLYRWLKEQGCDPELERYIPETKQRPDIIFSYLGQKYCLEYQCSTISDEIFHSRSKKYCTLQMIPLWILGGNLLNRKGERQVLLSPFQTQFLRQNQEGHWFLPSYCASSHLFIELLHPHPCSTQTFITTFQLKTREQMKMKDWIDPIIQPTVYMSDWIKALQRSKEAVIRFPKAHGHILKVWYEHGLHPLLLPGIIGLPLQTNILFETAPLIWQSYVFMDLLQGKKKGTIITLDRLAIFLKDRINRRDIVFREGMFHSNKDILRPLIDYFHALAVLGIVQMVNKSAYALLGEIKIPKTIEEYQRQEGVLFAHPFFKDNDFK